MQIKLNIANEKSEDLENKNDNLRDKLHTAQLELEAAAVRDRDSAQLKEMNASLEATVAIRDIQLAESNARIDDCIESNARIDAWTESNAWIDDWTDTESNAKLEATLAIRDVQLAESSSLVLDLAATNAKLEATVAIRDVQLAQSNSRIKDLAESNGVRRRNQRKAAGLFRDNARSYPQQGDMKRYLGFTEETPEPDFSFLDFTGGDCGSSAGSGGDDLFSIV